MSNLIDYIEKRIYQNKPNNSSNGQYSFGRVNTGESNSILGISQDNQMKKGGWEFGDETESSWNELYTLVQEWNYYSGISENATDVCVDGQLSGGGCDGYCIHSCNNYCAQLDGNRLANACINEGAEVGCGDT